jgi:ATP-dependent Clp protease adaptor protein ClpS
MFNSLGTVLDPKKSKAKYPEARVIVLDDNFNTFKHVANCLLTTIPGIGKKGMGSNNQSSKDRIVLSI